MRKLTFFAVLICLVSAVCGCDKAPSQPVPVAPVLKNIVMPAESNSIPGTDVTIMGRGFSAEDIISCFSLDGGGNFVAEIVKADNYSVVVRLPENAGGYYEVSVTRNGLTTVLPEKLYVAYVILLNDIKLSSPTVRPGGSLVVTADGIADGDKIRFESSSYPADTQIEVSGIYSSGSLTVTVPEYCYGINTITLVRDNRVGNIGRLDIPVERFSESAGGIVYYTSDSGLHGLVVYKNALGDAAMNWCKGLPVSYTANTSVGLYKGKSNTSSLVEKDNEAKSVYAYSHETPAELCSGLSSQQDGITYDDWFLPSTDELVELFKVKADIAAKGFAIPANNYWTSCEVKSSEYIWAMQYVNFYEAENVVTGDADRENWAIGTLDVRQF